MNELELMEEYSDDGLIIIDDDFTHWKSPSEEEFGRSLRPARYSEGSSPVCRNSSRPGRFLQDWYA